MEYFNVILGKISINIEKAEGSMNERDIGTEKLQSTLLYFLLSFQILIKEFFRIIPRKTTTKYY